MAEEKEKKKFDKGFLLFLIPSWGLSTIFWVIFFMNSGWPPKTPAAINDLAYLIIASVFFVLPFISRIRLGKLLQFERNLKETRESMDNFKNDTRQMFAVLSSASATVHNVINASTPKVQERESEEKPKTERESKERPKTAMELKILNTLWNRQVLKFPELNGSWTFRLNQVAPEFLEFREAGSRLLGEGLISETDIGQFQLTVKGLRYCAKHHKDFPTDMWVKHVPIPKDNLEKLLKNLERN